MHRGHQHLVAETVKLARRRGLPSVMVTFDPHPVTVFTGAHHPLILDVDERISLALESGIDHVVVIDFNCELAGLSPRDYVVEFLIQKLCAKAVVIGENFSFGADAVGTPTLLKDLASQYDCEVEVVALLVEKGVKLSSTTIRHFLDTHNVAGAARVLGRPFALTGEVQHGAGRGGRELGYPTANQYFPASRAVPTDAVYAGWLTVVQSHPDEEALTGTMRWGIRYPAAISVGTNPTFGDTRRSVETFVLDNDSDLYGRIVRVEFVDWVRDMVKFTSIEELLSAMGRDVDKVRQILRVGTHEGSSFTRAHNYPYDL